MSGSESLRRAFKLEIEPAVIEAPFNRLVRARKRSQSVRVRVLVGAVLLVLVAACGSSKPAAKAAAAPDPIAAWKADLAALGVHPMSWSRYVNLVRTSTCTNSDYVTYIAVGFDLKSDPAVDRVGLKHACPDRLQSWDQAISTVEGYSQRGKQLCGPRPKLVERMAVLYSLSKPSVPTDGQIVEAVC